MIDRYALALVGVGLVLFGLVAGYDDLRMTGPRQLAARLEGGAVAGFAEMQTAQHRYRRELVDGCSLVDLRVALTFDLAAADAANREFPASAVSDAAYETAIATARQLVACVPADGNAWLRLAMLEADFAGPAPDTLKMAAFSYWTAPNEGWVLAGRIRLLSRLVSAGVSELAPTLERDLRVFGRFRSVKAIAAVYAEAGPGARQVLLGTLDYLPKEKREALLAILPPADPGG